MGCNHFPFNAARFESSRVIIPFSISPLGSLILSSRNLVVQRYTSIWFIGLLMKRSQPHVVNFDPHAQHNARG